MAVATVSYHRLPLFQIRASVLALAFELYSILKVLLFYSYIIQQKERLCINRMNLYFRDIAMEGIFQKQKVSPLV